MCNTAEEAAKKQAYDRRKSVTLNLLILFSMLIMGALAVLVARLNTIVSTNTPIIRNDHTVSCAIYGQVSNGRTLLQCEDVRAAPTGR